MVSRRKASVRNATISLTAQTVKMFGQFVVQTVFVKTLGATYLGANGLFTNIIMFLSFAELGIGAAFSYELYSPLAEGNKELVSQILNLFKKIYNTIGTLILFLGLALSYFVPYLVKSGSNISHIRECFILYLLSTVVSYYFTYNRSLLIADQNSYLDALNQMYFSIFRYVLQILALVFLENYYLYLIIQIISNLLANLSITKLARKKYPYITQKNQNISLSGPIHNIKKNVVGTISSKIGLIAVTGTDNILISKFVGLTMVGIYSNYSLVVTGLTTIMNQVFASVVASFGNLGVTEKDNREKQIKLFYEFTYVNAFSTFFIGLVLYGVFQQFIQIWLGTFYKLDNITLLIIVVNFIFAQFRPALYLVNAYGLFWGYRYKSIVEALVNLGLSLSLVAFTNLGIKGVLIGTIIGNIMVNSWWDPLILFTGAYKTKITKFYLKYWCYLLLFLILIISEQLILEYVDVNVYSIFDFIVYCVCISVVVAVVLFIVLSRTEGERTILRIIRSKFEKRKV